MSQLGQSAQGPSAPAPAYFQALLERGTKRTNNDEPQLQLGLQDIARKVRNLGKGFTDARAHYLLSASGVNTSQALRDLDDLVGPRTSQPQPAEIPVGGVKETLAQTYQSDFQKMVDSHIQRAHDEFDQMIEERLHGVDWDAHRQRIYEHFGLKRPQSQDGQATGGGKSTFGRSSRRGGRMSTMNQSGFGISGMARSVIGTAGSRGARSSVFGDVADKTPADGFRLAPEDGMLRKKQEKYSDKVKDLNVARLQEKAYPLLTRFAEVEGEHQTESTKLLVSAFKALVHITGEDATKENLSEAGVIRERQYAQGYLDDNENSAANIAVRKRIIEGSRKYLETMYFEHIEQVISKSPREANMGGVPTALARVKGFVRVRAARKELGPDLEVLQELKGDYCWPIIFYLLRCGLFNEALQYVDENAAAFRQIDRQFVRYLKAYVASDDHRLPPDLQTGINNEYSQRVRLAPEDSIDPYRMVCYKIIGRCDLGRRSLEGVANDMMDWMWLQFSLAREYNRVDEFAHEAFSLAEVRQSVKDIGERYFGPGTEIANAQSTLFFMQVLAGLFEKAVADLYPHNYLSAVHFAIGLDYYGLLRVSDINNSEDLLTYTTRQQSQIAFGSMIGLYTRDFRTANATAAVDYITLICLNADLTGDIGKSQRELCHQALTEVVLETREFAQLLGDIRADGQRIKGAIDQRLKLIGIDNEREFLKHITLVAARTADEQGRTTDAALLYHLAEDYQKVYQVVNDALSLALTTELGDQPARLVPLKPRNIDDQNNQDQSQNQSSLSLTAIDDPVQLAKDIKGLYNSDAMYLRRIDRKYSDSCDVLLLLAEARQALEQGRWPSVVDVSNPSLHDISSLANSSHSPSPLLM
jgi:nuclear pore complex protein Nup93